MKALVYTKPFCMEWKDVPDPEIGPDEVLFRPRAVSICGSDLNGYRGKNSMRVPPLIMGHEFAGEVIRAGKDVKIPIGTRAAVNPALHCGECQNCTAGRVNLCDFRHTIGTTMPAGPRSGAMAEYVAVPERALVPLPDAVSFDEAAVIEPLAVALHAVKKAGDLRGKTAVVIGAGPIGLLSLMCMAEQKPEALYCVDLVESRLAKAKELGATAVFNSSDAVQCVGDLYSGAGVDVVVDAVAFEATIEQSIALVRNGGKVVVVGMGAESVTFPLKKLAAHEVCMEGSYTFTTEICEGLELIPRMNVGAILTSRFAIQDGAEAFRLLSEGASGDIKVILENTPA